MKNIVKSNQIKEVALNSAYFTEGDLKTLINQGYLARWMTEDEKNDQNIFILTLDE